MKILLRASFTLLLVLAAGLAHADTSLTAYGTYWDADSSGTGAGLRLKKTFLGFGAAELRGGYIDFSDIDTEMIPLDVSINARLPFFISPYAGVGAGYYIFNSDMPNLDNNPGYFAQLGLEATFLLVGVMAEVRFNDLDGTYFDGASYNAGILLKW
ncbi:hypothetical protein P4E94_09030 [Pontiellaceae bacterium B12219]|nr:hypothetical protein [Pontiellaceae bacterium B12219]